MLKKLEALFAEVIHRTENTRGKKKKDVKQLNQVSV